MSSQLRAASHKYGLRDHHDVLYSVNETNAYAPKAAPTGLLPIPRLIQLNPCGLYERTRVPGGAREPGTILSLHTS